MILPYLPAFACASLIGMGVYAIYQAVRYGRVSNGTAITLLLLLLAVNIGNITSRLLSESCTEPRQHRMLHRSLGYIAKGVAIWELRN